mmetsp:Transcript_16304/g.35895  ORF Transcript_16304/g.35895 Transcript_16304/m.35895 type:complete len:237 (+) Transcript_16304:145-855(+)
MHRCQIGPAQGEIESAGRAHVSCLTLRFIYPGRCRAEACVGTPCCRGMPNEPGCWQPATERGPIDAASQRVSQVGLTWCRGVPERVPWTEHNTGMLPSQWLGAALSSCAPGGRAWQLNAPLEPCEAGLRPTCGCVRRPWVPLGAMPTAAPSGAGAAVSWRSAPAICHIARRPPPTGRTHGVQLLSHGGFTGLSHHRRTLRRGSRRLCCQRPECGDRRLRAAAALQPSSCSPQSSPG